MNDWGWNPGTFQAVGGVATAIALFFVILSAVASKRSSDAAAKASALAIGEAELRTRPWVGMTGTSIVVPQLADLGHTVVAILEFTNVGVLPAEGLTLTSSARPSGRDEPSDPFQTMGPATIFPNELTTLVERASSRIDDWISEGLMIEIHGQATYGYGSKSYHTTFNTKILFQDPNKPQLMGWENQEVT